MRNPFDDFSGIAAPLWEANVDTDQILPGRFLKTVTRCGLSRGLFHELRFNEDGSERSSFILNREPWRKASVLIALDNFGCGSSREHAQWALQEFGIRCVIAPSFADIFHNNCFKNGILAIVIERCLCAILLEDAGDPTRATMTISLRQQTIRRSNGESIVFAIDADRKRYLLLGLDEIELTLRHRDAITAYEARAGVASRDIPLDVGNART